MNITSILRFIARHKWIWIVCMWALWQLLNEAEKARFEMTLPKHPPA